MTAHQFEYTPEGCEKARKALKDRGWTDQQLIRLGGWEIVHQANEAKTPRPATEELRQRVKTIQR